jgi:hypothetical protein
LSDDKDFGKKSYGEAGLEDLVTDRRHRIHEAFFANDNSYVLELNDKLKPLRSFMVSSSAPSALAIGKDGEQYLGLFNLKDEEIQVFASGASGTPSPKRTIAGGATDLTCTEAEAVDSTNDLYVSNWGAACGGGPNNIVVFAPHANGNAAPIQMIAGDQTGITGPINLALGADGNIYVANEIAGGSSPTFDILVFPVNANGNVAPIRTLQTGSYGGTIALGTNGEMYVGLGPSIAGIDRNLSSQGGIAVYAPGASGNEPPIGYVGQVMESQAYRIALQYPWYVP